MLFSPQLALRPRRRAAAAAVTSLTLGGSATSATASVTCPAGVIAGDIIVVYQLCQDSSVVPATAVPSGFTAIGNVSNAVSRRNILSYKKAVGTEASTSLTGMSGSDSSQYCLYYFRPNVPATTLTVVSNNAVCDAADPAAQTVAASGHTPPLIVLGGYAVAGAAVTVRTFTVGGSAAKDGEINQGSIHDVWLAYKLYNSSPADVVVDMIDEGVNYLMSCDITVA